MVVRQEELSGAGQNQHLWQGKGFSVTSLLGRVHRAAGCSIPGVKVRKLMSQALQRAVGEDVL